MRVVWGIAMVALSLLGWGGQAIVWFSPRKGVELGLAEAEADVEPTFWADGRGEALWDVLSLWTLVVAGVLLIVDNAAWSYFGLVGGGMYVYFGGRGILTRLAMQRRGLRIGSAQSVRLGYTMLIVWGVMALITIGAAVIALPVS